MRCSDRPPRVRVIVVNYRTPQLAEECLRSLVGEKRRLPGLDVVVVDNASGDGSPERLATAAREAGMADWVRILAQPHNAGFAGGNNAALRAALAEVDPPDYFVLLNPDTFVRPGALEALVAFLEAHPEAGIAGSRIEDPDGTPQHSAFRFPNLLGEFARATRTGPVERWLARWIPTPPIASQVVRADWVSGACLIVRRAVLEDVGLLDEGYFLYFEETDYCGAAARAGWSCFYVPASRVVHLLAQATRIDDPAGRRPQYWFESRRRYFLKNHGRLYAAATDLAWLAGHAIWRLRRRLARRPDPDPPRLLADFLRHSALFRGA